jgi:hypothetical protein
MPKNKNTELMTNIIRLRKAYNDYIFLLIKENIQLRAEIKYLRDGEPESYDQEISNAMKLLNEALKPFNNII